MTRVFSGSMRVLFLYISYFSNIIDSLFVIDTLVNVAIVATHSILVGTRFPSLSYLSIGS